MQAGYARVQDNAGLDRVIAVAMPHSDFLSGISTSVKRTVLLAFIASLLIVVTGFVVLGAVAGDPRQTGASRAG